MFKNIINPVLGDDITVDSIKFDPKLESKVLVTKQTIDNTYCFFNNQES